MDEEKGGNLKSERGRENGPGHSREGGLRILRWCIRERSMRLREGTPGSYESRGQDKGKTVNRSISRGES